MNIEISSQADFLFARIGEIASQVANVISVERIEDEIPVLAVELVIGPEALNGILELKHVVVGGQVEDLAVVLAVEAPTHALAVLGRELNHCTLGCDHFSCARHDRVEDYTVLIAHVEARDNFAPYHS